MSREIKFRAWYYEFKKYTYPELWDRSMPSNWAEHYCLEQFTGLQDKNGVDIYEGDIVKFTIDYDNEDFKPIIGSVIFQSGAFQHSKSSFGWEGEDLINLTSCEVIGNIHQHPELLKT